MMQIAAILVVRNGAPTLGPVLSHLGENDIDVYAVDHGSLDSTRRILDAHAPSPVVEITRVPFDGAHRWKENLDLKTAIADRIPHDWVIHVDADEIMESPVEGETLRNFLERMDRAGFDLIECDEFVFVPAGESEDHSRGDFVATMRNYYYFAPRRAMHRAIRTGTGSIDWSKSGGHNAGTAGRTLADECIRLRHYVGLSLDHLREQYLGRVFGAEELRNGWHGNRVATTPEFVVPPPRDRLFHLETDGWRRDRPETKHLMFNQTRRFRPPQTLQPDFTRTPMPFVVGVGRSGTTLLRFMLDSHPDLAITPETHWLGSAITALEQESENTNAVRSVLASNEFWGEMGLDESSLDEILARHDPTAPFDTLRAIYFDYARRHTASRVGDKTPIHGLSMTTIAHALPEVRFIHVIRDGRDVALSYRGLWFGPGDDPRDAAVFWLWRIREMRQQAQFLPHYMEVHYEHLITDPESVLRQIGSYIGLPFHAAQLQYHHRARARLSEMKGRVAGDQYISAKRRRSIHERTEDPPDASRAGRWHSEMPEADIRTFERITGSMLLDLGYELSTGDDFPDHAPQHSSAGPGASL